MRTRFDEQLDLLHRELIKMGSLCEQAILFSTKALMETSTAYSQNVFEFDSEIDQKERDIENLCMRLLLQQQPVARDLRTISAALKMISDMERIGDQSSDIAELALYIGSQPIQGKIHIQDMAEASRKMVTESINAFVKNDLELAHKVINEDDIVDTLFEKIKEELIQCIYEKTVDPKEVLDLLMAAKYLERIGDHAVNIAEWVEYSLTNVHQNNEHQNENHNIKRGDNS